ncbi:DUF4129 domain-containing protein [Mycolicibacterium sp.]|uniref:DUF4129 domain-containing protein n=1 Tax=Mycolicibacterium sp. TaxID=2320850 RepID=UPI003D0BCA81
MPGHDKATARTVTVIVLRVLATVALRGHLPDAGPDPPPADRPTAGPGSLIAVMAMLGVSVAVIVLSLLTRTRRRPPGPAPTERSRDRGAGGTRVPWRVLLVVALGLLVWLTALATVTRWGMQLGVEEVAPPETGAADAGSDGSAARPGAEIGADVDPDTAGGPMLGLLTGVTAALLLLAVVTSAMSRRRVAAAAQPAAGPAIGPGTPAAPDLARAAERGLAEINDPSRDPREAIIACYAAMERELDKSPGTSPRDSDTPSEVLARAIAGHALRAEHARELVELFEEARFSPHVMNESHRADAVRVLSLVQRELQGVT